MAKLPPSLIRGLNVDDTCRQAVLLLFASLACLTSSLICSPFLLFAPVCF